EAGVDELAVTRAAALLAVVVRAGAAGEEAEAVAEVLELQAERVRDHGLEPAEHPGANAEQHDAALPRLPEDLAEAVNPPDREHVRNVAAADRDRVLGEDELAQARRRVGEK